MSDSVQLRGLQPAGLLCPWDSLGKSTGVGIENYKLLMKNIEEDLYKWKKTFHVLGLEGLIFLNCL